MPLNLPNFSDIVNIGTIVGWLIVIIQTLKLRSLTKRYTQRRCQDCKSPMELFEDDKKNTRLSFWVCRSPDCDRYRRMPLKKAAVMESRLTRWLRKRVGGEPRRVRSPAANYAPRRQREAADYVEATTERTRFDDGSNSW